MDSKLTKKTYFTDESYTHSSQLTTYLESKLLYKLRYIDKNPDYQFTKTDAVKIGIVVDEILTEGSTKLQLKVKSKDNKELFAEQKAIHEDLLVTEAPWKKAMAIVEQLPKQPIWEQLKEQGLFQMILEKKLGGVKMCGKLDNLIKDIGIFDLKITNEGDACNEYRWLKQCKKFRYHVPAGVYRFLEGNNLPFYHICCYLKNGILNIKIYQLPNQMIDDGLSDALRALEGIEKGDFEPKLYSLDDAIRISWENNNIEPIEGEEESEF